MTEARFSLAHLTALDSPPPELIRIAAQAGFDFVGLRTIALGLSGEPRYDLAPGLPLYRETQAALADTGVQVLDIELARIMDGHDPRTFLPALETGASLGARHVLTSVWTPDRGYATEAFGMLCDIARPLGLTVNLEFVAWASCSTLAAAVQIVRDAARDNAGIMIDVFHYHHARIPADALDAVPRHWFHYAHISDDRQVADDDLGERMRRGREERLFPGEGVIDIAGIVSRLPADLVYAIELPHARRHQELGAAGFARECLRRTRRYLDAHVRRTGTAPVEAESVAGARRPHAR